MANCNRPGGNPAATAGWLVNRRATAASPSSTRLLKRRRISVVRPPAISSCPRGAFPARSPRWNLAYRHCDGAKTIEAHKLSPRPRSGSYAVWYLGRRASSAIRFRVRHHLSPKSTRQTARTLRCDRVPFRAIPRPGASLGELPGGDLLTTVGSFPRRHAGRVPAVSDVSRQRRFRPSGVLDAGGTIIAVGTSQSRVSSARRCQCAHGG